MARLIHIEPRMLAKAASSYEPAPLPEGTWRVTRPRRMGTLDPWFELTPAAPSLDTRVASGDGPGVAVVLETVGGVTGPQAALLGSPEPPPVVLSGDAVAPGTPGPAGLAEFRRHCGIRLCLSTEGIQPRRQYLVMFALVGDGEPIVQSFVGSEPLEETAIHGEERLPFLVQALPREQLQLDLRLRLAASGGPAYLGLRGAQGFLL